MVLTKPFDIRGGAVAFTGRDYTRPVLDIDAAYNAGEYGEIFVHIGGTPDALDVKFTSDLYPSQDDILAILLLGAPVSETSGEQAQSGGNIVGLVAASLAASGTKEVTSNWLQIAEVGVEGARLGTRLGANVFVIVDVDYLADDREESFATVTVEWQISRRWHAEFASGTAGKYQISLNWRTRF